MSTKSVLGSQLMVLNKTFASIKCLNEIYFEHIGYTIIVTRFRPLPPLSSSKHALPRSLNVDYIIILYNSSNHPPVDI